MNTTVETVTAEQAAIIAAANELQRNARNYINYVSQRALAACGVMTHESEKPAYAIIWSEALDGLGPLVEVGNGVDAYHIPLIERTRQKVAGILANENNRL